MCSASRPRLPTWDLKQVLIVAACVAAAASRAIKALRAIREWKLYRFGGGEKKESIVVVMPGNNGQQRSKLGRLNLGSLDLKNVFTHYV